MGGRGMKILKFHENQRITRHGCPDGVLCSLSSRREVKFNAESESGVSSSIPKLRGPHTGLGFDVVQNKH